MKAVVEAVKLMNTATLIQDLEERWQENFKRITLLNSSIKAFTEDRNARILELESTAKAFETLRTTYPSVKLPSLSVPVLFHFWANPDMLLGDAMEMLLHERGPMTQREIIDAIREGELELSSRNPHVVVANVVKRDKQKRFIRLKSGKVGLTKK